LHYVRSTYVPEDGICLLFAAASGEGAADAARQAGPTGDRISRSIHADQPPRRVREIRRAPIARGKP